MVDLSPAWCGRLFSGGWILVSQRLLEYNAWASIGQQQLDGLSSFLHLFFFLRYSFRYPESLIREDFLVEFIMLKKGAWKKGTSFDDKESHYFLLLCVSSLYDLSPPSNGLVYMSIFLPSWHFSHFPKIEFRWPFSSPLRWVCTHKSPASVPPNISPRGSSWSPIW